MRAVLVALGWTLAVTIGLIAAAVMHGGMTVAGLTMFVAAILTAPLPIYRRWLAQWSRSKGWLLIAPTATFLVAMILVNVTVPSSIREEAERRRAERIALRAVHARVAEIRQAVDTADGPSGIAAGTRSTITEAAAYGEHVNIEGFIGDPGTSERVIPEIAGMIGQARARLDTMPDSVIRPAKTISVVFFFRRPSGGQEPLVTFDGRMAEFRTVPSAATPRELLMAFDRTRVRSDGGDIVMRNACQRSEPDIAETPLCRQVLVP
jgi:hypothetical protein